MPPLAILPLFFISLAQIFISFPKEKNILFPTNSNENQIKSKNKLDYE